MENKSFEEVVNKTVSECAKNFKHFDEYIKDAKFDFELDAIKNSINLEGQYELTSYIAAISVALIRSQTDLMKKVLIKLKQEGFFQS